MANIRFGGGIADMRGSIGGNTFSRGAAGAIARTRIKGVNRRTSFQQAVRNRFAMFASMWGSVAMAAYRAGWEAYAAATNFANKVGDIIQVSGMSCFVRTNTLELQGGGAQILTAPPTPGFALSVTPSFLAKPTLAEITITAEPANFDKDLTGDLLLFFMGRPQSAGRNTPAAGMRYIGAILGNVTTPPAFPFDIPAIYPMTVGGNVTLRTVHVDPAGKVSSDDIQIVVAANP